MYEPNKTREENIQALQFYIFLEKILSSSIFKKEKKSKNPLIKEFIRTFQHFLHWQSQSIRGYRQLLSDYPYWNARHFYCQKMEEFINGQLLFDEFIGQISDQIFTDEQEARKLEADYSKQLRINIDPKSFKFSQIFFNLRFGLENFEELVDYLDEIESENDSYRNIEEYMKEEIELTLIHIKNYLKT